MKGRSRRIRPNKGGVTGERAGVFPGSNDPVVMHVLERLIDGARKENVIDHPEGVKAKARVTLRKFSWEENK